MEKVENCDTEQSVGWLSSANYIKQLKSLLTLRSMKNRTIKFYGFLGVLATISGTISFFELLPVSYVFPTSTDVVVNPNQTCDNLTKSFELKKGEAVNSEYNIDEFKRALNCIFLTEPISGFPKKTDPTKKEYVESFVYSAQQRAALTLVLDPENRQDALRQLEKVISIAPSSLGWRDLGQKAFYLNTELSIDAYSKALKGDEGESWDVVNLVRLYKRDRNHTKAGQVLVENKALFETQYAQAVYYTLMAEVAFLKQDNDRAIRYFVDSESKLRILLNNEPESKLYQKLMFDILNLRGDLLVSEGNLDAAESNYQKAFVVSESMIDNDNDESGLKYLRYLSASHNNIGDIYRLRKRYSKSREYYLEALKIREDLLVRANNGDISFYDVAISHLKLGDIERLMSNVSNARRHYQKSLGVIREANPGELFNSEFQRTLSLSYNKLGDVERQDNNIHLAQIHYYSGLDIRNALASQFSEDIGHKRDLMISYFKLSRIKDHYKADDHRANAVSLLKELKSNQKLRLSDRPIERVLSAELEKEI